MITYNNLIYTDDNCKICVGISPKTEEVKLHPNTRTISASAFEFCKTLKKIEFNDSLSIIYRNAFVNCINLKEVDFTRTKLFEIDENTFLLCKNLKCVKLSPTCEAIKQSAFKDSGLEEITLSKNLKTICDNAFENTNLKKIKLPKSVTFIGEHVFKNTQITNLYIPENVKQIKDFLDGSNIKNVYYKSLSSDVEALLKSFAKLAGVNVIQEDDLDYLLSKKSSFKEINDAFNKGDIDR